MTAADMARAYAARLEQEGWDAETARRYARRRFGWVV